jgi:hypothetical protein
MDSVIASEALTDDMKAEARRVTEGRMYETRIALAFV